MTRYMSNYTTQSKRVCLSFESTVIGLEMSSGSQVIAFCVIEIFCGRVITHALTNALYSVLT
jgi:hypothetical protein